MIKLNVSRKNTDIPQERQKNCASGHAFNLLRNDSAIYKVKFIQVEIITISYKPTD